MSKANLLKELIDRNIDETRIIENSREALTTNNTPTHNTLYRSDSNQQKRTKNDKSMNI